jgi:hypothetical protein
MSALLALLLLLSGRRHVTNGQDELSGGIIKRAQKISLAAFGGVLAKEQVGLANVVTGERLEKLNNGAQTTNSLKKTSQHAVEEETATQVGRHGRSGTVQKKKGKKG